MMGVHTLNAPPRHEPQCFEVPMPIPTPNTRELHFVRAKRVKTQRTVITVALRTMCVRPPMPVVVTLTRVAWKELDDDNLAFAFKAIRDAIAEWLGVKDGPRDPVRWVYAQTPAAKGYQAARIRIEARA